MNPYIFKKILEQMGFSTLGGLPCVFNKSMVSWSCKAVIEFEITSTCGERLVLHRIFKTTLGREEKWYQKVSHQQTLIGYHEEKLLCLEAQQR